MNTIDKTESTAVQIAKTIIAQIKYGDAYALMAWGAQNFVALEESKEFQGGLRFRVNGLKFKGFVQVQLRWIDDYTISFLNKAGEVKKKVEGIFCDQLVEIIDFIEGK